MLLKMQRNETALSKAIESGDVDLIYQALLHLKDKMHQVDFFQMLNQRNTQAFDYYLQVNFCSICLLYMNILIFFSIFFYNSIVDRIIGAF